MVIHGDFAIEIYQGNIALITVGNHSCALNSYKIIHNYINIFAKITQRKLAKTYIILFHINKNNGKILSVLIVYGNSSPLLALSLLWTYCYLTPTVQLSLCIRYTEHILTN